MNATRSRAFFLNAKVIFLTAFSLYFTFFLINLTKIEVKDRFRTLNFVSIIQNLKIRRSNAQNTEGGLEVLKNVFQRLVNDKILCFLWPFKKACTFGFSCPKIQFNLLKHFFYLYQQFPLSGFNLRRSCKILVTHIHGDSVFYVV